MLPIIICRHWHVEWLSAEVCRCEQCGKIGHWFDGMVLWQRRPCQKSTQCSFNVRGAHVAATLGSGI